MRVHPGVWEPWDKAIRDGRAPAERLGFLSDEELIELLATGEPSARRYELSLVATELANRLVRFRRLVDRASAKTHDAVEEALTASEQAKERSQATANSVQDHIEVRRDQIEDEPVSSRQAAQATRRTRDALEDVQHAESLLAQARGEVGRHVREPEG